MKFRLFPIILLAFVCISTSAEPVAPAGGNLRYTYLKEFPTNLALRVNADLVDGEWRFSSGEFKEVTFDVLLAQWKKDRKQSGPDMGHITNGYILIFQEDCSIRDAASAELASSLRGHYLIEAYHANDPEKNLERDIRKTLLEMRAHFAAEHPDLNSDDFTQKLLAEEYARMGEKH